MEALAGLGYVALCLIVAILGRGRRIGYWGTVIVSLLVTPFVTFLILVLFGQRPVADRL